MAKQFDISRKPINRAVTCDKTKTVGFGKLAPAHKWGIKTPTLLIIGVLIGAIAFGSYPVLANIGGGAQGGNPGNLAGHPARQPYNAGSGTLKGYWPLDSAVNDVTGNASNGTTSNATSATGKYGNGYTLTGTSSSYVGLGTDLFETQGSGTISAWVKTTSLASYQNIFSTSVTSTQNTLHMAITPSGQLYVQHYSSALSKNDATGATTTTITANSWYHVAVTGNGTTWKLYINGVEQATTQIAGANSGYWFDDLAAGTHTTRLGNLLVDSALNSALTGTIDDFRVYDSVLTADQIAAAFNGKTATNCDQTCKGWWKFSEASGTLADASGNGNTGTVTSAAYNDEGVFGGGMKFDGSASTVNAGSSTTLNIGSSFTLSAWVKLNTVKNEYVLSKRSGLGSVYGIIYNFFSANKFSFYADGEYTGTNPFTTMATSVSDTNWHHIVWTYDGTTIKGYLDGRLDVSSAKSFTIGSSASTFYIGSSTGSADYFSGNLDDVRVYSRPLADYEIYDHYLAGK